MLKVVSWNIFRLHQPWRELVEMARQREADVAPLQEPESCLQRPGTNAGAAATPRRTP